MDLGKGQKQLLRCLKDDKNCYYSKWVAGGDMPVKRSADQSSEIRVHISK